jgi:hypothetical protein
MEYWPFIVEGLPVLNELAKSQDKIAPETLFNVALNSATLSESDGLVVVITSKNDKPLMWGIVFNNTVIFKPKSCAVYAVYSNGKAPKVMSYALSYLESWARHHDYKRIQAFSPCMNGSRFRLFEHVWKFTREAVVFRKDL